MYSTYKLFVLNTWKPGRNGGVVFSTVASQHEGYWFESCFWTKQPTLKGKMGIDDGWIRDSVQQFEFDCSANRSRHMRHSAGKHFLQTLVCCVCTLKIILILWRWWILTSPPRLNKLNCVFSLEEQTSCLSPGLRENVSFSEPDGRLSLSLSPCVYLHLCFIKVSRLSALEQISHFNCSWSKSSR